MTERPIVLPPKGEPLETPYGVGKVEWPEISSLNASNDNALSDLEAMDNGDGTALIFCPKAQKVSCCRGLKGLHDRVARMSQFQLARLFL